jgi:hypothetical protein
MFGQEGASQLLEAMSIESNIEQVDMDGHLPVSAEIGSLDRSTQQGRPKSPSRPHFFFGFLTADFRTNQLLRVWGCLPTCHPYSGRAETEFYFVRYCSLLPRPSLVLAPQIARASNSTARRRLPLLFLETTQVCAHLLSGCR